MNGFWPPISYFIPPHFPLRKGVNLEYKSGPKNPGGGGFLKETPLRFSNFPPTFVLESGENIGPKNRHHIDRVVCSVFFAKHFQFRSEFSSETPIEKGPFHRIYKTSNNWIYMKSLSIIDLWGSLALFCIQINRKVDGRRGGADRPPPFLCKNLH